MLAAPFVANPPGDADRKTEIQAIGELGSGAGEAVRDGAGRERLRMLAKNRNEILMRIALMQEHRLADACGNAELLRERSALHIARREIAEVVEPAFTDSHRFG